MGWGLIQANNEVSGKNTPSSFWGVFFKNIIREGICTFSMNARVRSSALMFFAFAAFGGVGAFLNLFYLEQGMTLTQVGFLVSIPAGMSLLAAPIWAAIADHFNLHRYVLPLTMVLSLPFALLFPSLHDFGQLFIGICLFAGCYAAIIPLSDNAVLVNLGSRQRDYGKIRLWGSIGVGALAWITGWLVQRSQLNIIFYIYIIFMSIAAIIAFQLPKPPHIAIQSYWKSASQFFHDNRWKRFLFGCLLAGFSQLFLGYYIFIFSKNLGAQEDTIGFFVAIASATNIVVFFLMPRILKRWSALQVMIFSNILLAVRCTITAFIREPNWVILVQLLDGPTWGTMWAAGVHYANEIAPHGLGASAQALYNAIYLGLGGIISAGLGGVIYSTWGAPILFLIAALMGALSALVFISHSIVGNNLQEVIVKE
jgi:MFS transporter, PPP family, 3-phenylpropionic acid transporter